MSRVAARVQRGPGAGLGHRPAFSAPVDRIRAVAQPTLCSPRRRSAPRPGRVPNPLEPASDDARLSGMKSWVVVGAVLIAVSGCTSHSSNVEQDTVGTVRGRMIFMGGPAPGAWPVTPGFVTLRGPSFKRVAVDSRGRFQVITDPGTYHVTGTSREFAHSTYVCRTTHAIVVTPHKTSDVVLGCFVR
jgi:hypothetical protein